MITRRLTPDDAPALRSLWAEGLRSLPTAFLRTEEELNAIPDEHFRAGIEAFMYLGCFDGDRLLGFVVARRGGMTRLMHIADIGPLYVSPNAQRQGLGRKLMQAALAHLAEQGVKQVELAVEATNERAISLYTALGFITFGRRPRAVIIDGVPHTDLLMICALDGADLTANA